MADHKSKVGSVAEDEELRQDEAQRFKQHEAVKGRVRDEVRAEIARSAHTAVPPRQIESVADDLKAKAVADLYTMEGDLERGKLLARVSQIVDYLFYLLYGIIGLQIALELLGARENNAFKQFVDAITSPFLFPFKGLLPDPAVGGFQLMVSYLVGLVVYVLLHQAVRGLLRLVAFKRSTV